MPTPIFLYIYFFFGPQLLFDSDGDEDESLASVDSEEEQMVCNNLSNV